jgi:hypothetical protein
MQGLGAFSEYTTVDFRNVWFSMIRKEKSRVRLEQPMVETGHSTKAFPEPQ